MKKMIMLIVALVCLATVPAWAEQETALLPALKNRTTLHSRYDPARILTDAQIKILLEAGFSMPTGGGQRSLEFFAVTNRETMTAMRGGKPYSQALEAAPCILVIAADNNKAFYEELQEMDAGLAAGAILTQASEMGLTTCVLSITPQPKRIESVRSALNMPDSFTPILMVAIGYPSADAITSASVESWDDTQIHFNTYNGKQ